MTRYFCDQCGCELFMFTNGTSPNCDGYKTYNQLLDLWQDLCNDCRKKYYMEMIDHDK